VTKDDLLIHLTNSGVLATPNILKAFEQADRADFVMAGYKEEAYHDHALPIGFDQSISQPFTVAFMLELLQPQKNQVILDLGTGAGWTAALLAEIVGPKGRIYSVEILPELISFAKNNLSKYNYKNIVLRQATSERLGLPEFSPFEKILVSAAAQELPATLVDQLAMGGTLVMPVGETIVKANKMKNAEIDVQTYPGFAFVPLRY
jgi:protein-L-isoaspartate(D-aspartate) O-methyltransferase